MAATDRLSPVLCLASVSPRRRELLAQIGVSHTIVGANIDETALAGEAPADYVTRLAMQKALTVWQKSQQLPVLAADTTVVLDGSMFGKPRDRSDGLAMLERLSGRTHEVLTAVALVHAGGKAQCLSRSAVRFRALTAEECSAYWQTEEPRDKAGGYAIQGLGAVFVESLAGSHSGVMGLPLCETAQLLCAARIAYWSGAGA
jgi:septum formation protein